MDGCFHAGNASCMPEDRATRAVHMLLLTQDLQHEIPIYHERKELEEYC